MNVRPPALDLPPEVAAALLPTPVETLAEVETPAVIVDVDRVGANLARAHEHLLGLGLSVRPHVKTHKIPAFAHWQRRLGATGITAQKVGEAQAMADAGLDDILIPYNILGPAKLARLRTLRESAAVTVAADSQVTVEGYATAFAEAEDPLPVLVECDTGARRCGVQTPEAALALAREVAARPGLRFAGLMTYPAAGKGPATSAWLREAIALLTDAGLPPGTISGGGTPDLYRSAAIPEVTEHRPGTYIYADRMQVAHAVGTLEDCALTVLATVVSRPTEDRAVLDAGSKALTSDIGAMDGHGHIREAPAARIAALSEEHGVVETHGEALTIGKRVRIVPNHACPVSNLFDRVVLVRGDAVLGLLDVAARGRVT